MTAPTTRYALNGDVHIAYQVIGSGPVDLVFVMDTTGSMREELEDLQANLVGVIRILSRMAASLRVGFVAYKDTDAAYLTQEFPLGPMNSANSMRTRNPRVAAKR